MAHFYDRPDGTEDLSSNEWDNLVTHTYTVDRINAFSGNTEILDTLLCLAAIEKGKHRGKKITATQAVDRALRNLRFFVKNANTEWEANQQLYGLLHKLSKDFLTKTTFDRSKGSGNRYRKPFKPADPNSRIIGVKGVALTQREMRQLKHSGIDETFATAWGKSFGKPPTAKCGFCGKAYDDDSPTLKRQEDYTALLGKPFSEATELERQMVIKVWDEMGKEQRDNFRQHRAFRAKDLDAIPETERMTYIRCTPCRTARQA